MGARLAANTAQGANARDHPLSQLYESSETRALVKQYNQVPEDQRAGWRIENPHGNAWLWFMGYNQTINTPAALAEAKTYTKGEPNINFDVGFQPFTASYATLERQGNSWVREFLALPSDERDDYLRAHPDHNVLLYNTGHTGHIYSVPAWEAINKR